jgi:hypothetical protein
MAGAFSGRIKIGDSVLYQQLEGEIVLLNMGNQEYYGLNDIGAAMWKSLLEAGSVAAAGDRLSAMYEIDDTVIRADLQKLVRDLVDAGLLQEVSEP